MVVNGVDYSDRFNRNTSNLSVNNINGRTFINGVDVTDQRNQENEDGGNNSVETRTITNRDGSITTITTKRIGNSVYTSSNTNMGNNLNSRINNFNDMEV